MTKKLKKILYVEDDQDIAQIAKMIFEDFGGFEVKHCCSGVSALEELIKFSPQLILLDMMMPNMDGLETLVNMKKVDGVGDLTVVFMTAKIQKKEQQLYFDAGAIGIIKKPFDPETLCDSVNDLWNKNNDKEAKFQKEKMAVKP